MMTTIKNWTTFNISTNVINSQNRKFRFHISVAEAVTHYNEIKKKSGKEFGFHQPFQLPLESAIPRSSSIADSRIPDSIIRTRVGRSQKGWIEPCPSLSKCNSFPVQNCFILGLRQNHVGSAHFEMSLPHLEIIALAEIPASTPHIRQIYFRS